MTAKDAYRIIFEMHETCRSTLAKMPKAPDRTALDTTMVQELNEIKSAIDTALRAYEKASGFIAE